MRSGEIVEGGLQATVQDYPGRRGMLAQGFFPAGPMDHLAHRAANLLVGNPESAATLEITLGNFRIRFDEEATVAVCGAEAPLTIGGEEVALWESHRVRAGRRGLDRHRARARVPPLPRGRRRLRRAGAVRLARDVHDGRARRPEGRPLRQGDRLPIGEAERRPGAAAASGKTRYPPTRGSGRSGRCAARRRHRTSSPRRTWRRCSAATWTIDRNSNRTGIRLESHKFEWARESGGIAGGHPSNILDNSYPVGAINVNGDLPVILGPDGPTAGGFVVAATVIHADFWKIGQFRPVGDTVRFREVTIDEAIDAERALANSLGESNLESS